MHSLRLEALVGKDEGADAKAQFLRAQGCLNLRPEKVSDPLFREGDFFDARDLVQIKYEMLRRVRRDGQSVGHTAASFGFSRPVFYQARLAFEQEGLPGLVPKKRGPRGGHKLTEEVMEFVAQELVKDESIRPSVLAGMITKHFQVRIHPRSIERALGRPKKKRS
jgi:transposase